MLWNKNRQPAPTKVDALFQKTDKHLPVPTFFVTPTSSSISQSFSLSLGFLQKLRSYILSVFHMYQWCTSPPKWRAIPEHCGAQRPIADHLQRLALRGALQQQRRRGGAAARGGGASGGKPGVPGLGAVLVDEAPGGWLELGENGGSPVAPVAPVGCK